MSIQRVAKLGFSISVIMYILLHFTGLIFESKFLLELLSVFGFLALLFALLLLIRKNLPLFLIVLAIVISILGPEVNFYKVFSEGFREMRFLLPLLFIIPFVGFVLKQEDYVGDTIVLLKRRLKNSKVFYGVLIFLTQIISLFLSIGSIVVVHQMIQSFFLEKDSYPWLIYKSTAVMRGFALTTMWVISSASFAFAVEALNAPLLITFIQGFVISIVGILLAVMFLTIYEKRNNVSFSKDIREVIDEVAEGMDEKKNVFRNPIEFAILFISLLASTLILNALLPIGLLTIIPIVVIIWVVVYFIVKRKLSTLFIELRYYFTVDITAKSQEWGLLLSVGLVIAVLNASGLSEVLMKMAYNFTENTLGLNFLWVLPIIVLSFSFIGIGPLAVMVLISGVVQSIHLPYPPELIVLAMTLGSMMSVMFSPLVLSSIILSSLNKASVFENSFKQNWKFAIVFYFVVEMYIQLRII